jgi:hypothetical protein
MLISYGTFWVAGIAERPSESMGRRSSSYCCMWITGSGGELDMLLMIIGTGALCGWILAIEIEISVRQESVDCWFLNRVVKC